MARLSRLVLPGFPYHVTQRGNRRMQTFFNSGDTTIPGTLYLIDRPPRLASIPGTLYLIDRPPRLQFRGHYT